MATRRELSRSDTTDASTDTTHEARDLANDILKEHGFPARDETAKLLSRSLSLRSRISTDSDLARRNNAKRDTIPATSTLKVIGRGSCGTVFEVPGSELAYKKGKDTKALWNDFHLTNRMAASTVEAKIYLQDLDFAKDKVFPRTPRCHNFIVHSDTRGEEWWTTNAPRFAKNVEYEDDNKPSTIFALERILPLHEDLRRGLIQMFFDEDIIGEVLADSHNEACLIRLYFGKLQPTQSYDTLLNFELHFDQMQEIGMSFQELESLVSEMALGLAIAHWAAKIDCRDTEFVLGTKPSSPELPYYLARHETLTPHSISESDFQSRTTHMWMLDFDKARSIEYEDEDLIKKLVAATMGNDPYFPNPVGESQSEKRMWKRFEDIYLKTAKAILEHKNVDKKIKKFPGTFIKAWKTQANKNKKADEEGGDVFG